MAGAAGLTVLTKSGSSPALPTSSPVPVEAPIVVDADRTIAEPLALSISRRVIVAKGATLTLLGDLAAPAERVFFGEGRVDLQASRVLAARPEWWGAVPNDVATDCGPAIAAAIAAHPATHLGPGDYHVFETLRIAQHNRRLWGIGRGAGGGGTRLVGHGRDGPVVLVGTSDAPPSINDHIRGVDLRWIELTRAAPARPTTGDDQEAPTGLAICHVLDCTFEGLRSTEHAVGYSIRGAVRTLLRDCTAFRSIFTDAAHDIFIGFDMDGRHPFIPTGANASIYLTDCNARTGNRPALPLSVGCRLLGAFSDTFLTRFETTELGNGIVIDGRRGGDDLPFGQLDVHIDTPVLDQCLDVGIAIANLGHGAMIDIGSPWLALAPQADAGLRITDSKGATTVTGGQVVGTHAAGGRGVLLIRTGNVSLAGIKIMGLARPIAAMASSGLDLTGTILATDPACPVVALDRCRDSYLRLHLLGARLGCAGLTLDGCLGLTIDTAGMGAGTGATFLRIDGRDVPPATWRTSGRMVV